MPIKAYFENPNDYPNTPVFYNSGGAPKLVKELINTIEKSLPTLYEVNICWFLYNNHVLHEYLKGISQLGIKVNIITIPLNGYDDTNPQTIKNENGEIVHQNATKFQLAKTIYNEFLNEKNYPNIFIHFYTNIFVRSKRIKRFSRGNFPYALHIKSALLKKTDGDAYLISSSNFAVRDVIKFEALISIEQDDAYTKFAHHFFDDLIAQSTQIKADKADKEATKSTTNKQVMGSFNAPIVFTAPFYHDSNNLLEEALIQIIKTAHKRIIVCAQHLAAFNYTYNTNYHSNKLMNKQRPGILEYVLTKAKQGIKTTCISQTFAQTENNSNYDQKTKFRQPINKGNFCAFIKALSQCTNVSYFVNNKVHTKYIIIDNLLIFCTYNFTPTQFLYLDQVKIDAFDEMPNQSFNGIHSEVGSHVLIQNQAIVQSFVDFSKCIINDKKTIKTL